MDYVFKKKRWLLLAQAIDAVGYALGTPPTHKQLNPRRILVVRLDQLGDIVLALPFLKSLRESFPGAAIDFLTTSVGKEIVEMTGLADDVIVWNCPWFDGARQDEKTFFDVVRLVRTGAYDCGFDLRGDARLIVLLRAAGVTDLVAYGASGAGFLATVRPAWDRDEHEIDKSLRLLRAVGGVGSAAFPEFNVGQTNVAKRKSLAIHADAGSSAKRWPAERFIALMNALRQNDSRFEFNVVGTNTALGAELAKNVDAPVDDRTGKTTIRELSVLLKQCAGLITNDSGPAHLAAALGVPVWILWSGTARASIWAPRGENVFVLEHPVPCAPCALRECPVPGHPCLEEIPVDVPLRSVRSFYETARI